MQRPDRDAPDAEWLVYADALQISGDPRGELITLTHAADVAARDAYVHEHAEALLGHAAKAYRQGAYRLTWRHCFIDRAEIRIGSGGHGEHWVLALLQARAASELREIVVVGVTEDGKSVDLSRAIAALAATPWPASCTSLAIVDERATRSQSQISREFGVDENLVAFGDLGAIWKLPRLEHLRLDVADSHHLELGEVDGDRLRSFTLRALRFGDGWGEQAPGFLGALEQSAWSRLEGLELRLAETFIANIPLERKPYVAVYSDAADEDVSERYDEADDGDNDGIDYSVLEPLLAKLVRSPLRRLALTSFDSASSLLDVLRRTGLPPTLRVLDLSDSALRREHVQWMRDNRELFASLTQLVLERTSIEDEWLADLAGLGPAIVHSHASDAPTYRYVVGQE